MKRHGLGYSKNNEGFKDSIQSGLRPSGMEHICSFGFPGGATFFYDHGV